MNRLREIEIYEAKEVADDAYVEYDAQQLALSDYDTLRENDSLILSNIPAIAIKNISSHIVPVVNDKCKYSFLSSIQHNQKIYFNGRMQINAENNVVPICGLIFDIKGEALEFPEYAFDKLPIRDRILMGVDGFIRLDKYYYKTYVPRIIEKHSIQETQFNPVVKKQIFFKFENEADAIKKIKYLTKMIVTVKKIYTILSIDAFKELQSFIKIPKKIQKIKRKEFAVAERTPLLELCEKLCGFPLIGRDTAFVDAVLYSGRLSGLVSKMILNNKLCESAIKPIIKIDPNEYVDKLEHAWKNNISWREFEMPYANLEKDLQENVNVLYGVAVNIASATRNNKCIHVSLFSKVVNTRDPVAWKQLKEIAKLQDENKFESIIYCDLCGLYALCPHHYFIYDREYENDILRNSDIVKIFSSTEHSVNNQKFCRLCGESIEVNSNTSEEWATIVNVRDRGETKTELEKSIQFALYQNFKANFVIKGSDIDISSMSSLMSEKILPYIQEYDIKLNKSKIISNIDAKFSVRLVINIYAFAIIIHFVHISDGMVQLTGYTEKKNEKDNVRLQSLFNSVFKILTKQNEMSITRLKAFTREKIKELLLKAYRQVSSVSIVVKEDVSQDVNFMDLDFLNDYCYEFIHLGRNIISLRKNGKQIPIDDVSSILNIKSTGDMKFGIDIYAKAKLPKIPQGDNYFWKLYEIIGNRIISHTMIMDAENSDSITKEFQMLMSIRDPAIKMIPQSKYFDYIENSLPSIPLNAVYGADGHIHKWNKFIFENKKGEQRIFDKKNLSKIGKSNFVNMVCSICGDKKGETKNDNIRNVLNLVSKINVFYNYYKNKCPMPQKHDWKDDTCAKCGMTVNDRTSLNEEFYTRFATEFDKILNLKFENLDTKKIDFSKGERSRYLRRNKRLRTYDNWKYESKNIVAVAELANVDKNVINNIGLMNDEFYETISKNKANPHNTATPKQLILQCDRVVNYINELVIEYQNFRTCNKSLLPPDMAELCEKSIDVEIPMIHVDNFWDELSFRMHEKPLLYSNWCLNYFSTLLLEMDNPITKKFASQFLLYVIQSEKNMSKPDPSKFIHESQTPEYFKQTLNDDADDFERMEYMQPEYDIKDDDTIDSIVGNQSIADLDIEDFAGSTGMDDADDI